MASNKMAAEQLLELLLTLKKTTPAAARDILNGQPAIAYALISLMVSMNAINTDVVQKILSDFNAAAPPLGLAGPPQYATPTPPPVAPHGSNGYPPQPHYQYPPTQPAAAPRYPTYPPPGNVPGLGPPPAEPVLPPAIANFPPEQKALILRVLAMTNEQVNSFPHPERATYQQIRSTLGVPTA